MNSERDAEPPLVVDLDGTLLRSDTLLEGLFTLVGRRPAAMLDLVPALLKGRAALKAVVAAEVAVEPEVLPLNDAVVDAVRRARAEGRRTYLVSAGNADAVERIAAHLALFDGAFGSSAEVNLAGRRKAEFLVARFGVRGFDYIGNSAADLHVWREARRCWCIAASAGTARRLRRFAPDAEFLVARRAAPRDWLRAMRVHQWAKNGLIFVPLAAAHRFDPAAFVAALAAFVAFSLCASSVYLVNDAVDITADRRHRTKFARPLAAGVILLPATMLVAALLLAAGLAIAVAVSRDFLLVLLGYLGLTTTYSFWLKRKLLIDVVVLGMLYTVRVIGGAAAIAVVISEWLLAFSMFIFLSLALIKRYVELAALLDAGGDDPSNRNYRRGDLSVVSALAAAAGFNAVTVLALWINSPAVSGAYARPQLLWGICPLMLYWIGRALMLAHRRAMEDDPVVFAFRDRPSLMVFAALIVLAACAI